MNQGDPFGNYLDDDKTVLKPSPGLRKKPSSEPLQQPAAPVFAPAAEVLPQQINLQSGDNPLVGSAMALLSLVVQLRNSVSHADVPGLRNKLISEVKTFEAKSLQAGCPPEHVQAARYALCSLLDEAILNTPWGCNSIWTTQNLLVTFHKEAWGGEKFFQILQNLVAQPGTYLYLLELFYFCLSLGFEGKYRVQEHGLTRLEEVRENLYLVIRRQRGDFDKELSPHWRGITDKRNALAKYVPLWVVASVAGFALMLVFLGFLYAVNQASNPLLSQLYKIKDDLDIKPTLAVNKPAPAAPVRNILDDLRAFLAPEIQQHKVTVDQVNGKTVIRIMAKSFFASGSDQIQAEYYPLLEKIAQALTTITDPISVVGHTDNVPIFTARFPSNWDLSSARAKTVAAFLSGHGQFSHPIASEGRADTQSLVPNDSPEHRAMNRRIEINF
ncbi:type IVB secretion system protein IcmH/DotU [Methylobacter sp. Wu1]|uniref:type IVB secretion system protein IcmH/DotU n=1 Tax=Methylobacter sp. Wu1 TaxID=3119359 RepID=UPI002F95D092